MKYTIYREETQHLEVEAESAREAYQKALETDVGEWMVEVKSYEVYVEDGHGGMMDIPVDESDWEFEPEATE